MAETKYEFEIGDIVYTANANTIASWEYSTPDMLEIENLPYKILSQNQAGNIKFYKIERLNEAEFNHFNISKISFKSYNKYYYNLPLLRAWGEEILKTAYIDLNEYESFLMKKETR